MKNAMPSDNPKNNPWPSEIRLNPARDVLTVAFDDGSRFELAAEYLRVESPSAEVRGHGGGPKTIVRGKENVTISGLEPVGNYAVRIGFDEGLSHLIEAGVDCFLMPSRFEPCGLNQMYSQRYGTPPIVHATGGLLDTVVDYNPSTLADGTASGFLFYPMQADTLLHTIQQAIRAYHNKKNWQRLQKNGMAKDFGWPASAATYRQIYLSLLS